MKLDELDVSIIKYIGTMNDYMTTTDIVKELFSPEDNHTFKIKDNLIRNRLKNMDTKGVLVHRNIYGNRSYFLAESYVVLSGNPKISINGCEFKGEDGVYIFVIGDGLLKCILS